MGWGFGGGGEGWERSNTWKEADYGFDSADWELPARMRGGIPKKLALAARGLGKNTAAGMVGVGFSVFAPRLAPLLGLGAILADDEGPKRMLFMGVRFVVTCLGRKPPAFLDVVDGGDEHGAAREPLPFSIDAVFIALRPFSNASAMLLGVGELGVNRERGFIVSFCASTHV